MENPEKALARRIRELRRRHFGARGKARLAELLGLNLADYERFERGTLPPGEMLVKICEITGEDLQWLLTGVAGRGTVVISGTRKRHQDLLTRLARMLDDQPELAAPIEAFVDLLGATPRRSERPELPAPQVDTLIPIYHPEELPEVISDPDGPSGFRALAPLAANLARSPVYKSELSEPAVAYDQRAARPVQTVMVAAEEGIDPRRCLCSAELVQGMPGMLGMEIVDEIMVPMFRPGEAALLVPGAEPRVGKPVVVRVEQEQAARCRIWLGHDDESASLGRLCDDEVERVVLTRIRWAAEVLYRLSAA